MKAITILILFIPIITISYDLVNGVEKKIYSLNYSETYSFYLNTFQYQNLSISLNMSYMNTKPFTYSHIYEYESRYSSSSLTSSSQSLSTTTKNNELTSSFTYLVKKYNTKYIALKITPNYNINYIVVIISAEGGAFDLSNGLSKNITNLKSGISYYFFIPSTQLLTALITLNMNYMNTKPFTYSYIYEYESRYNSSYSSSSNKSLSITTKNNELTSSLIYSINYFSTKYIALKFTPNYNINYIIAKYDIKNYKYELSYNGEQTIYNLTSQNKYYLFFKINYYCKIKVTLTMKYYNNSIFYLCYYERNNNYNNFDYGSACGNYTVDYKNSQSIIAFFLLNRQNF